MEDFDWAPLNSKTVENHTYGDMLDHFDRGIEIPFSGDHFNIRPGNYSYLVD